MTVVSICGRKFLVGTIEDDRDLLRLYFGECSPTAQGEVCQGGSLAEDTYAIDPVAERLYVSPEVFDWLSGEMAYLNN